MEKQSPTATEDSAIVPDSQQLPEVFTNNINQSENDDVYDDSTKQRMTTAPEMNSRENSGEPVENITIINDDDEVLAYKTPSISINRQLSDMEQTSQSAGNLAQDSSSSQQSAVLSSSLVSSQSQQQQLENSQRSSNGKTKSRPLSVASYGNESNSKLSKLRARASVAVQNFLIPSAGRTSDSTNSGSSSQSSQIVYAGTAPGNSYSLSRVSITAAGGTGSGVALGVSTSSTKSITIQKAPLSAPAVEVSNSSRNFDTMNSISTISASTDGGDESPRQFRPTSSIARKFSRPLNPDDDDVAIGTKIGEGHSAFVLMYDMLTGMRNAVSRCVAKPYRPLEKADFIARHKLTFDILGNELTPSSRYEFKFKDYAPWVFRYIRDHFKIEAADYLVSLTSKYVLSELGSPGKSGSFFYFSQDYRFIIKTIHHTEHKFLCHIMENYYEYIQQNPNTLISRYYGLHRVKLPHGRKIHFVVMGNVFPPNRDIHEKFDLKGSLIGRYSNEDGMDTSTIVQKDLNWLAKMKQLQLGPEKAQALISQLERDTNFLIGQNIMDYSLLLGIHYMKRGNSERIRDNSLAVYEPNPETLNRRPVSNKKSKNDNSIRKMLESSGLVQLGPSSNKLPEETPSERKGCIFYDDDGGYLATDESNSALTELYYLGIIDILTPYNMMKRAEHAIKSLKDDKELISAVPPDKYGMRFIKFMRGHVVAHDDLDDVEKKIVAAANKPAINGGISGGESPYTSAPSSPITAEKQLPNQI